MTPLGNRSANRQSRIPVVGLEPKIHLNNENIPPSSNTSRLLAPTKSSAARSRSPSPSPIPLPVLPRPTSTTPGRGRLSAVTSHDSLNASFARRQSLHRPSTTSLLDDRKSGVPRPPSKSTGRSDRPSRPSTPVTNTEDTQDQSAGAGTGPANKSSLKTLSILQREERTDLSPRRPVTRRGSATPNRTPLTRGKSFSKLPLSSVHNSPAIVSPVLDSVSTSFNSPHFVSPIPSLETFSETASLTLSNDLNEYRPPRTSSLKTPELWNEDVGLGIGVSSPGSSLAENQERKYLPAVHSFSRPRAQQMDRSQVSVMSLAIPEHPIGSEHENLVASTTPKIVCRSPSLSSKPAVEEKILTFAGRSLGNPTDLAALDGSARSSKRKDCFNKPSPLTGVNSALQDLPPRVPSPSEQNKLSPIRLLFGDKGSASDDVFEYTRVKQLSGSLLSSSFVGSTLSISDEADHLLLGDKPARMPSSISQTSLAVPADAEFDLPSPSENGFHVSWPADFGFNSTDGPDSPTVQSSPSVRPKAFSGVSEESERSVAEQGYYYVQSEPMSDHGETGVTKESRGGDIKTTLSILEGTPDKADAPSTTVSKSVQRRSSVAKLPRTTPKDGARDTVYNRNDRLPSYMLPTPASEARKTSTLAPPEIRRSNASTPNLNARRESQTTKIPNTPSLDKSRLPPSGRRTPASELCGTIRSGRSTPTSAIPRSTTPIARPSTGSQQTISTPKSTSKTEAGCRASIGHIKIVRQTPQPIETSRDGTFPPTRPRSESKGKSVLNNLKGLFSGKRDATTTPSSSGRRFSIGSRKSVSVEADVPDVPTVPDMPTLPAMPAMPALPATPALPTLPTVSDMPGSRRKSSGILPRPRRKSTVKDNPAKKDATEEEKPSLRRKASKHKVVATETTQEPDSGKETRDTVALMEMGLTLRQEASKEDDLVRKERMASFAQVMLDTVTNAVEAERNMYTAMQAAEQAKMSYMMTQQSVQEMNKLVSTSRRLPLFKKKKQSNGDV
ncbi:hypothetical protein M436DRAFT_43562 [Aureobasidium namibiae CBS 147.97]|uniref:Uncharacterized protein n=1 Tax=Aureobasidium namibiae CBS 147.97 TaxID=1043004 RepID=A0A074XJC2_9PEZI|nr:uncharacterized protein M436DRAFT_43562 [Aureobasidium namibiae CBS 147.97]KEQ74636.1 hypothetical protein M436DRAFT_43562 [Aureobasidium namibiae CBS 147.97]